jgi:TonB family protein
MKLFVSMVLVVLAFALAVRAQNAGKANIKTKHFEKGDLSFDFPAEWTMTDNSDDVQRISISPLDGTVQIAVAAQPGSPELCDFPAASRLSTNTWLEHIAKQINAARPLQTSKVKTQIGGLEIEGLQLRGSINHRSLTSEIYSLRVNLHFVSLVCLRIDDNESWQAAWESVRTTLKLASPIFKAPVVNAGVPGNPNVLNGRALKLAYPAFPDYARRARVGGVVVVEVVIDEAGKVIFAQAIEGPSQLRDASVVAAQASKFAPAKLCGEPIRITGVIQYNFVLQT